MGPCISSKAKKTEAIPLRPKSSKYLRFIENEKTLQESYNIVKKIGEGATSHVKLVSCKYTKVLRAVKSISIGTERQLIKTQREIDLVKRVDHPTLLRSIETYKDKSYVHIVSEYYSGPSLYDLIVEGNGVSEVQAKSYMYYILTGLNYLHGLKIMHRDIKPENLMFETSEPNALLKIIDFGSAKYINKKAYKKKCGTTLYMSPEVIQGKYTEKCDVWSAGIIFYILIGGIHPFYSDTEQDLLEKIKHLPVQFRSPKWASVSSETIKLIEKMLEKSEKNRLSIDQILKSNVLNMQFTMKSEDISGIYSSIISFKFLSEVHKCILNMAILRILHSSIYSKQFLYLDFNNDGLLSLEDFKMKNSSKGFNELGTTELTFTEFAIGFCNWAHILNLENLESLFKLIDTDNDNLVNLEDLVYFSTNSNLLEKDFKNIDSDNDGMIKLEEFSSIQLFN